MTGGAPEGMDPRQRPTRLAMDKLLVSRRPCLTKTRQGLPSLASRLLVEMIFVDECTHLLHEGPSQAGLDAARYRQASHGGHCSCTANNILTDVVAGCTIILQYVVPSGGTMIRDDSPEKVPASVRSVERTLDLLVALERAGQPVGLADLSRSVDLPKPTAQRLLSVLERRGFVRKERRTYQLGTGIVTLAGAFLSGDSLARAAQPILEELCALARETTSLQVRHGTDRVVIQRIPSPHSLGYRLRIGQRLPLYIGAAGQVLSASMPEKDLRSLVDGLGEIRLAGGGILSPDECLARLEKVRLQGFAVSFGEREAGVVSVAAPVRMIGGRVVAAVALTGPPSRMTPEKVESLSLEVRRAAQDVALAYART